MASVIGVRFKNAGKLYYFAPGAFWPTAGDAVIVETVRGLEYGEVVTGVKEVSDDLITPPLKKVIRIATAEDAQRNAENRAKEKDAMAICQKKIAEHKLQMKLVGCEYTFDNSKILFYFTSDKRVDFRVLVKDLASRFRVSSGVISQTLKAMIQDGMVERVMSPLDHRVIRIRLTPLGLRMRRQTATAYTCFMQNFFSRTEPEKVALFDRVLDMTLHFLRTDGKAFLIPGETPDMFG